MREAKRYTGKGDIIKCGALWEVGRGYNDGSYFFGRKHAQVQEEIPSILTRINPTSNLPSLLFTILASQHYDLTIANPL